MLLEVCLERRGMERFQLQLIIILIAAIAMAWSSRPPPPSMKAALKELVWLATGADPTQD